MHRYSELTEAAEKVYSRQLKSKMMEFEFSYRTRFTQEGADYMFQLTKLKQLIPPTNCRNHIPHPVSTLEMLLSFYLTIFDAQEEAIRGSNIRQGKTSRELKIS